MKYRYTLDDSITLECSECTTAFIISEKVYREQERIFCPKCGRTNVTRHTDVIVG